MRSSLAILAALTFPQMACARDDGQAEKAEAVAQVSEEEIFQAAGFSLAKGIWQKCGEPGTISYEPGTISQRGDFNGDDLLDALVTEGGTYCFGMTGSGYTLVSRGADGGWRILDERIGIAIFLETRGGRRLARYPGRGTVVLLPDHALERIGICLQPDQI